MQALPSGHHGRAGRNLTGSSRSWRSCGRSSLCVQAASVPVTVRITKQVDFGESLKLVGNQPCLGNWDLSKADHLRWTDGHVWSSTFNAPVGVEIRFKLVRTKDNGEPVWEDGSDRKFKALGPDYGLHVSCEWDKTGTTKIEAVKLGHDGKASLQSASSNGVGGAHHNGTQSAPDHWSWSPSSSSQDASLASFEEDARSTSAWVGGAPQFVRSRKESGGRAGVWRTEGLQGPLLDLVQGDQAASNWLKKLELMKGLLVDRPHMMRPQLEELAACYVYATWVNTGAITCVETGGHHRPNHHANNALQMFRSLEWAIGDASYPNADPAASARVLAARRLHTRLPSISGEFRVSVPLTRIRDIAHRGDIPKDLKDEIKHTLQNKLHRSAGPEDLVATEAMLVRITAQPGQYSDAFVSEFKVFTRELRDFFNASGLTDLLDAVQQSLDDNHRGVVTQFRAAMQRLDQGGGGPSLDDLMSALFMGTQARALFAAGLSAGLRNDVRDDVLAMRQRWRLTEIRLEEYTFVLLSRIIAQLEAAGGAGMLARANAGGAWKVACAALTNGLRNLGLSQFATQELLALENELEAWLGGGAGPVERRESALRGKASAERVLRLASQYSDLVMDVYCGTAAKLGPALGVPEHMSRIFGESEVRASVAFQVSRLAAMLVKALRGAASQDAWDGLVTGEAVGRLVAVEGLSPEAMEAACRGHNDDVVLLARRADGDEEVGPLGPRLAGVVLRQELPHLSHLGVRARQEKCIFATCDDDDFFAANIQPLVGKRVLLAVAPDGVTLKEASGAVRAAAAGASASNGAGGAGSTAHQQRMGANGARAAAAGESSVAATQRARTLHLVPLAQAQLNTCGSKAAKCGELERLAQDSGAGLFTTPPGVVLPFGTMELALAQSAVKEEMQSSLSRLDQPGLAGAALEAECGRLVQLVQQVEVPGQLLDQLQASFPPGVLLAVRSSANVEDLAGMSAAGLYESKVGVAASDRSALQQAVAAVWASLYSRRAVLSRRSAGVPQASACMAVLVMELVAPEVSFVLHTARPRDNNANIVLAELAPGQGETLASGTRGSPWRLEIDKSSSKVDTLAFANFSRALVLPGAVPATALTPQGPRGLKYSTYDKTLSSGGAELQPGSGPGGLGAGGLVELEVDYSRQPLSTDALYRERVGQQLARIGMVIEAAFGGEAQDIEGGLLYDTPGRQQLGIAVFQTRPQL